jgi:alkanesulfonate monooxygenase SsuD/methylene tetrahydromethanopterin reductase-like flavin-dependent oxidoreductase (luciferase family)
MSPERPEAIVGLVREGIAKAAAARRSPISIAPYLRVSMGEDLAACRDAIRPQLALYIGGMGARSKNYYNDLTRRLGYEAAAADIQDHFLAGQRKEAEAAVPDTLSDEISLVGSKERIHDRLQVWKELAKDHRVGWLVLTGATPEALDVVAEAVL